MYSIRCGTHCVENWSWYVPAGQHKGYTLWGVWGGVGELKIGTTVYPVSAGDIFFLDYQKDVYGTQTDHWLSVKYVDFDIAPPFALDEHRIIESPTFMEQLFLKTKQYADLKSEEAWLWLRAMLSEYHACPTALSNETSLSRHVQAFYDDIRLHPEVHHSIQEYASDSHYSTDHFIRAFKQKYGISPYKAKQHYRLDFACSLLLHSSLPINEISELCGFDTPNSFTKFFYSYAGVSPLSFRNRKFEK